MNFESHISELNGYLKALQRISGNGFSFGVRHCLVDIEDVDAFISAQIDLWGERDKLQYIGRSEISYRDLVAKIKTFLFRGILSHEKLANPKIISYFQSVLLEDINEFYCQASVCQNSKNPYYPLIDGPVYLLDIEDNTKEVSLFYLVKIDKYYVLTFFSR